MPTKVDKMFALYAVEKKAAEERKMLEYECRDELLDAYREDGTDRRTSPYFGPEAGKYSVKRMKGKPAREEVSYVNDDWEAFDRWLRDNPEAAIRYCFVKCAEFSEWWLVNEGELPDGMRREVEIIPGTEGSVTAQIYSFKPEVVLSKLAEGGNFLEGANQLLLGEGDE